MPRHSAGPTVFNEVPALSIKNLRDSGFLDGSYYRKTIRWKSAGKTSYGHIAMEIEIIVDTEHAFPSIRFIYSNGYNEFDYLIPLKRKPTNTGIGRVWYFAPAPGLLCLKLYLHDSRFMGRKQIKGGFYRCQVLSGVHKRIDQNNSRLKKVGEILRYQGRKHYKTVYAGTWTKHQLKVQQAHNELQRLGTINLTR